MNKARSVAQELADLVQAHYYSEDFELVSAVRHFHDSLEVVRQAELRGEILRKLWSDGTLVEVLLCGALGIREATPALEAMLDRETQATQLSRALIEALGRLGDRSVFPSLERFLDSDQEREALMAMASVDFPRAAPHLFRRLSDASFADTWLHVLAERKMRTGVTAAAVELRNVAGAQASSLAPGVEAILRSRPPSYNPFREDEVECFLRALESR